MRQASQGLYEQPVSTTEIRKTLNNRNQRTLWTSGRSSTTKNKHYEHFLDTACASTESG